MIKKLQFTNEKATLSDAHAAGGCLMPSSISWPVDDKESPQLHLITIPIDWIVEGSAGWISIFTPYSLSDNFVHWESLTTDIKNKSVAIIHNNNSLPRNEYQKEISTAKRIFLVKTSEIDTNKNFDSKILGEPAWLQDQDSIDNYKCVLAINGDDIDTGFPEEPGIFSDGMIYLFLKNGYENCVKPSVQGLITFQFS